MCDQIKEVPKLLKHCNSGEQLEKLNLTSFICCVSWDSGVTGICSDISRFTCIVLLSPRSLCLHWNMCFDNFTSESSQPEILPPPPLLAFPLWSSSLVFFPLSWQTGRCLSVIIKRFCLKPVGALAFKAWLAATVCLLRSPEAVWDRMCWTGFRFISKKQWKAQQKRVQVRSHCNWGNSFIGLQKRKLSWTYTESVRICFIWHIRPIWTGWVLLLRGWAE